MRKINEDNERIKRRYLQHLRNADGRDEATVDKAAAAILRFESSTSYKNFKLFHIEQAVAFKRDLAKDRHHRTGKPLSKATIDGTLRAVKGFVHWLAGQPGYKSRISYSDASYFNNNTKDARIAHTQRVTRYPTLEQCQHAFAAMPEDTDIERRNKALFAFLMLTGARDGAIASLTLQRIDLVEGCVHQDARDVKTKFAKSFTTYFLPIGDEYLTCFENWVAYLRQDLLFGHTDALFPKTHIALHEGAFTAMGLSRETYSGTGAIREIIKAVFTNANLPAFPPHSFRKTLAKWADGHYPTREGFKAFSQNIGHSSEVTTVSAYLMVSQERQAELIRGQS